MKVDEKKYKMGLRFLTAGLILVFTTIFIKQAYPTEKSLPLVIFSVTEAIGSLASLFGLYKLSDAEK